MTLTIEYEESWRSEEERERCNHVTLQFDKLSPSTRLLHNGVTIPVNRGACCLVQLMPRILPRLLKALDNVVLTPGSSSSTQTRTWNKRGRSVRRESPPRPDWTGHARKHSLLADDVNPYTNKRKFRLRKALPPQVDVDRSQSTSDGHDGPRTMTVQEREWYSSPYCACFHLLVLQRHLTRSLGTVRMLGSPLRHCIATGQHLPRGEYMPMSGQVRQRRT